MRVPADLQAQLGVREIRRSLVTDSPSTARLLAGRYAPRVMEMFAMVRSRSLSKEEIQTLMQEVFAGLSPLTDRGFIPQSDWPLHEIDEQRENSVERIEQLETQVRELTFDVEVAMLAESQATRSGINFDDLRRHSVIDLQVAMARALIEQQRLHLHRLHERLATYEAVDPLLKAVPTAAPTVYAPASRPVRIGPTLGELVEKFLTSKRASWRPKTSENRRQQLQLLIDHLSEEKPATSITADDLRGFRDGLLRLRHNHHVGAGRSFASRQTPNEAQRVSAKTAKLLFDGTKTLFAWALAEGYLTENPASVLRVTVPKKAPGAKPRRPFSKAELEILFGSPIWTGAKSLKRRFLPGDRVISDARYWVPLLGFYTGMRLGEIIQLHLDDVRLDGEIPHVVVTVENSGPAGSDTAKVLKSPAAARLIPLHPDLLAMGFADFVRRRTKQRHGKGRLFFEVAFGGDGVPSTRVSKWFARVLGSVGLTDPALVFHSFRHSAKDALRGSLAPSYVVDRIIGHEDASSAAYGDGAPLSALYEAVKKMVFPTSLLALVKPPN